MRAYTLPRVDFRFETAVIRFIYNLFWPIGLLFFLPGYFVKMIRRGGYRKKFGQRLGIYDGEIRERFSKERLTWLHAVSVGEVNIALKLANALRALEPDLLCALTTTTTTGFALARKNAPAWIEVIYSPLDFWPIMRRAFSAIHPARIILVEAEIWPNLAAAAHSRRIPLALVNARLSPRSERRYRRFRFFVAPTFRLLDLVCVPEQQDIKRWAALGVARDRIRVTGSIKYDPDIQARSVLHPSLPRRSCTKSRGARRQLLRWTRRALRWQHASWRRRNPGRIFLRLRQHFPSSAFVHCAASCGTAAMKSGGQLKLLHCVSHLPAKRLRGGEANDADCILLDTTGELRAGTASPPLCSRKKSTRRMAVKIRWNRSWRENQSYSVRTWKISRRSRSRSSQKKPRSKSSR